jgi:phage terminase large subunit-like protein
MAKKVQQSTDINDIRKLVAANLRRTATSPGIAGYKPQAHQMKFHMDKHKIRLFIGGNRSGKTVSGGSEMVMCLAGTHPIRTTLFPPPFRGRCVGVDFESGIGRIILPEIARWIPPSLLIGGSWEDSYVKGERTLKLTNGSTCEFLSNDQEVNKHAGVSRHGIWVDEHCDIEIWNENVARTVDTAGHIWITVTPLLDISWEYDTLYTPGLAGSDIIGVHEVSTSENIYVNDAQMDILTMGMSDAEKEARKTGSFMQMHGTIFKGAFTKANIIPPIIDSDVWPMFRNWGCGAGFDHGYTNPTAVPLCIYDREGKIIVIDEYYEKGRNIDENAKELKTWFKKYRIPEYIMCDPSMRDTLPNSGLTLIGEYAQNEIYLSPGNNAVDAGIARLRGRFKNNMIMICSNCTNLIWELERYQYAKFVNRKTSERNNTKETPLKKNDHMIDALRYYVMSTPQLFDEAETKVGNIINSSEAIEGERIDESLAFEYAHRHKPVFDEYGLEV